MCGLAGFIDPARGWGEDEMRARVSRMADAIRHRGPDDAGAWADAAAGIALGHRRLSILDLSAEGHQPMASADGRFRLVFNGEIYNCAELHRELPGERFRGHSDTEVMLACFARWGIEAAVPRLVGMFAFALWDSAERVLWLGRDRLGEKPLYYGTAGSALIFASELKALRAFDGFAAEIDRDALASYLRHNYLPAPHTIYRGVRKLPPGHLLRLDANALAHVPQPRPYWSAVEASGCARFQGSDREATEALDGLLRRAVAGQMVADVPLGAFLSGGIDSSTIVALMQAQARSPIRTFTIGFDEKEFDESGHARAVARHLGTDHTELRVTPQEAREVIPLMPAIYDEPFADSSQIPTYLVARLARRKVAVSLSGDGGDELFGGYNRYVHGRRIWQRIAWLPLPLRRGLGRLIAGFSPAAWSRFSALFLCLLPASRRPAQIGDKAHKLAELLRAPDANALYRSLVTHWQDPASLVIGGSEPATALTSGVGGDLDFSDRMMLLDQLMYLPDDLLVKVDRAAMAVSLETRMPFLDHRVVEFAWSVPLRMKLRHGSGKWLLRQVLNRYVPPAMIDRPKMGFGVPIGDWLRGPLRAWGEDLLSEDALARDGYLMPGPIREKWTQHLAGTANWQYPLWDVLMFQAWLAGQKRPVR